MSTALSAGARVAHTFELLEHILLDLADEEDTFSVRGRNTIFTCQRVCRAFRDTIVNSSPIQAVIFCTPPDQDLDPDYDNMNRIIYNRSVRMPGPCRMIASFMAALHKSRRKRPKGGKKRPEAGHNKISAHLCLFSPDLGDWRREDFSWRKMYLYRGAYEVTRLEATGHTWCMKGELAEPLRNPTLGEIVDWIDNELWLS